MEGAASLKRNEPRALLDADEVGGGRRSHPPYDRGVKYAQALIAPMKDGEKWKLVLMSDRQVEVEYIGTFEDCQRELKHYAKARDWERRSLY